LGISVKSDNVQMLLAGLSSPKKLYDATFNMDAPDKELRRQLTSSCMLRPRDASCRSGCAGLHCWHERL